MTDNLDNNIYNYPLTAYISIPEEWEKVLLVRGTNSKVYQSFSLDSMQVIFAEVIPDGGVIQLSEFMPSYVENENNQPQDFVLYQNFPNPFNPATTISYEIKSSGYLSLNVYDVLGNKISELVGEEKPAGKYILNFDAGALASGVYTYVLNFDGKYISKKMMLIK